MPNQTTNSFGPERDGEGIASNAAGSAEALPALRLLTNAEFMTFLVELINEAPGDEAGTPLRFNDPNAAALRGAQGYSNLDVKTWVAAFGAPAAWPVLDGNHRIRAAAIRDTQDPLDLLFCREGR